MLFAELESDAIAQLYEDCPSLKISGDQATKNKVVESLNMSSGYFHFTGHSYHDTENPLQSALALVNDDLLTLEDILKLDLSRYCLVCLSACETGLTSDRGIVDEYVGLVSGFLAAGVDHVISTLWTVDEIASALLMIRFHQFLKRDLSPASALAEAQHWLKTINYRDLISWQINLADSLDKIESGCEETARAAANIALKASQDEGQEHCPYTHPYYWAGFTITGKVPQLA